MHLVFWRKTIWKVHVVDLGQLFLFKNWRVKKVLIPKLTRCEKLNRNLTTEKKFNSKSLTIWRVLNVLIQNMTRRKKIISKSCFLQELFLSKSCVSEKFFLQNHAFYQNFSFKFMLFTKSFSIKLMLFRIIFSSKSCFSKMQVKRIICALYGVNRIKTWFFVCKNVLKTCFLKLIFLQNHAS